MEIRDLNKDERSDALILAREALFENTEGNEKILSFLQDYTEDLQMIGAYVKDDMKGAVIYEEEDLRIVFIAVDQTYRNRKQVSVILLDAMKQKAEDAYLSRLCLNARASEQAFYEEYGFEVCGEETQGAGLSFVPMEYLLQREWLGKTVTVITDRPYGSFHPSIPDVLYPVNYGYVKELAVSKGEFQDAYIIGPEEPVEEFTGVVSGIVYHLEDTQSRWIVSGPLKKISREEIISLIGFEEQYHDCRIVWADEKQKA